MSSGKDRSTAAKGKESFNVQVIGNRRLTDNTFEIRFRRPENFEFLAGQKISVMHGDLYRDYSLISPRQGDHLAICVRRISGGALSPVLAGAGDGDPFKITPAFGYFLYNPSQNPAIFIATGTGIAPFVAFAHDGVQNYLLLHGVRTKSELYYRDLLSPAARQYTPCLSTPEDKSNDDPKIFYGRVTEFLEHKLPDGIYDFYLCGRGEMLRDATRIIDRRFEGSRMFSELFF